MRLPGQGVPHLGGQGRGALIVKLILETLRDLTPKQKELLAEFDRLGADKPAANGPADKNFKVREEGIAAKPT